jgi:transforming growth factor-beta-induced protein
MTEWDHGPVSYGFGPEEPWYRQRGPLTAGITAAISVIFLVVAVILWSGSGNSNDAAPQATAPTISFGPTSTTLVEQTSVPATVESTVAVTTVPVTTTQTGASTTVNPAETTTTSITAGELTVWDLLQARSNLSRAAALLMMAELDDVLRGTDEFTFFAPTNEAFADFEATAEGAAIVADPGRLTTFLLRHLAFPRKLTTQQMYAEGFVLVATGEFLDVDPAARTLDGVGFLLIDDAAGNGVLHVMEDVLAP